MESEDPTSEISSLLDQLYLKLEKASLDPSVREEINTMIEEIKVRIRRLEKEDTISCESFNQVLHYAEQFYGTITDNYQADKFTSDQNCMMTKSVSNDINKCNSSNFNSSNSLEYDKIDKEGMIISLKIIFEELQIFFQENVQDLIDLEAKLEQLFNTLPITQLNKFQSFLIEENEINLIISSMLESLQSVKITKENPVVQLQHLLNNFFTEMKRNYIVYLSKCEDKRKVLFENISPMKAKSHLKLLLKLFYPEKCQWCDKNLITSLFSSINDLKPQVHEEISIEGNISNMNQYEQLAQKSYQYAYDLRQIIAGKTSNHAVDMSELENLTKNEMNNLSNKYANDAYDYYKFCCIIADENRSFVLKSIHYRRELAKCRYISQRPLEAQICILSATLMLMKKFNEDDPGFESEMKQNLQVMEDIKGIVRTIPALDNDCKVLVPVDKYKAMSYFEKEVVKKQINGRIESLCKALILRTSSGIIPYSVPTDAGLFLVDFNMSLLSFIPITLELILSRYIPGFSLFKNFTYNSKKKGIYQILKNAIQHFEKGNFKGFIKEIASQKYLVKYNEANLDIELNIESFCKVLLANDCSPDGIFFVLNILGESLLAEYVNYKGVNYNLKCLMMRIEEIFTFIWNDSKYIEKAANIDKNKMKLHANKTSPMERIILTSNAFLKGKVSELKNAKYTGESNTTVGRLNEIKLLAKLNLAIISMFILFQRDTTTIHLKEIRDFLKKNPNLQYSHFTRLDDIEDLCWMLTEEDQFFDIDNDDLTDNNDDSELGFRENSNVAQEKIKEEKIKTLIDKANFIISENEKNHSNKILSLQKWKEALSIFEEALKIDKSNQTLIVGRVKCLLHLCNFLEVEKCISELINPNAEMLFMQAYANRKVFHYEQAKRYLNKAMMNMDPQNCSQYQTEMAILSNLSQTNKSEKLETYHRLSPKIEESFFISKKSTDSEYFKILSIDGGGIRGLLPAIWLTEIERLTNRPISHLFNLLAGTSTGAITASALSIPVINGNQISSYIPQYKAYDIVKLYQEKKNEIFSRKGIVSSAFNLGGSKYNESGRKKLFEKCFGNLKLSNCLGAVVFIPVVCEKKEKEMKFFSSLDETMNFSLVDDLLAAGAAPTFFNPYKKYIDGGILVNNPAMEAYLFSKHFELSDTKQIFVMSMGTGAYIPDPFDPGNGKRHLFWDSKLNDVNFPVQEFIIDQYMTDKLQDNYFKWQVYLDRPIRFDDVSDQALENLQEFAFQKIEEMSISGELNKIIEFLIEK